jgi:hypothetical protein
MPIVSYFKRDKVQVIEQGVTTLYVKLVVGASGAVTSFSGYGIDNLARNATGNYTITLDRKFKKLLGISDTLIQATPQGLKMTVEGNNVSSAGTIVLEYNTDAGTATELSSGTIVLFAITVGDTAMSGGVS